MCFAGSDDIRYKTIETGYRDQPLVRLEMKQLLGFSRKKVLLLLKTLMRSSKEDNFVL